MAELTADDGTANSMRPRIYNTKELVSTNRDKE